jgi:hypothetical protein
MIQQTKVNHPQKGKVYNFGILAPRNVKKAFELDKAYGNSLWKDAEIDNIQAYKTVRNMGKFRLVDGFKKIIVHFVFADKHDLRHKARLVAGGHLKEPTMKGSHSCVVSLRSLRICLVAAKLSGTKVGDISSAYLEATQKTMYASLLVLNSVYLKAIHSSLREQSTVYAAMAQPGIIGFQKH